MEPILKLPAAGEEMQTLTDNEDLRFMFHQTEIGFKLQGP